MSDTPRGISELSRDIGLDKSAVQRIFQTLLEEGYIEKTADSSKYRPTLRIWELGSRVIAQNEVRRLVRPILKFASKVSGLTAYLTCAAAPDVIYFDKIEGEKGRPNSSDPGQRIPMHATASGRAILAFLPDTERKPIIAVAKADGIDEDAIEQELEQIRGRLFATTERGMAARVSSVAAPIWGAGPSPLGSIVLTSDSTTLPQADFERIGAIAINAAEQATGVLGGVFPITHHDQAP